MPGCAPIFNFKRLFAHFLSGVVFFAEYANGQNVLLYSLIYNASYILPDALIGLAILALPNVKSMIKQVSRTAVSH